MPDKAYSPLRDTNDWLLYSQGRGRQKLAGLWAGVLLVLALAVLVDGLVARMIGGGSYRIEMLAGTSEPVSGPLGQGKPSEDEIRAFPIPVDAPVEFEFSGFFTSYWFGTGMWRGVVHVPETAESGTYALAVGIEGQPSSTFQTYTISVARSAEEQNRQALSFVRRMTGMNPFYLAAFFAVVGLGLALGNFCLGNRGNKLLAAMGLSEIFRVQPEGEFLRVFAVTGKRKVEGTAFVSFDADLMRLGKVIFDKEKGGLCECLFVKGEGKVPQKGSFIAFWEPVAPERSPLRKGIFTSVLSKKLMTESVEKQAPAVQEHKPDDASK